MELQFGEAKIKYASYPDGKCINFGKHRCMVRWDKKMREEQKSLSKSEKCKGRNLKCESFIGSSIFTPEFDEQYLLPPVESEILSLAIAEGDNVLIVGPAGAGKSSLVLQLASIFNWGVERFSCSDETTSSKIMGQWVVTGDHMDWVDGHITHAMRNGLILLEDEADFMRPELRGEVHSVMEQGGSVTLTGVHPKTNKIFRENLKKHPQFRWISTANTIGYGDDLFIFHGTQYLNAASRDRYEIIINMGYRPTSEEIEIVVHKTGVERSIATQMVRVANDCRDSIKDGMIFQFSLRRLLSWGKYHQKFPSEVACKLSVLNFTNETDRHTVKSLMRTHMNIETD